LEDDGGPNDARSVSHSLPSRQPKFRSSCRCLT
jgi:hypothetical protein